MQHERSHQQEQGNVRLHANLNERSKGERMMMKALRIATRTSQ